MMKDKSLLSLLVYRLINQMQLVNNKTLKVGVIKFFKLLTGTG